MPVIAVGEDVSAVARPHRTLAFGAVAPAVDPTGVVQLLVLHSGSTGTQHALTVPHALSPSRPHANLGTKQPPSSPVARSMRRRIPNTSCAKSCSRAANSSRSRSGYVLAWTAVRS